MVRLLAELGSIHAAAQEMGVTQPAVTKSLHEFESLLGVTLFERTRHGVVPTAFCAPIIRLAQDVYSNLETASAAMRDLAHGENDAIRIGVTAGRAGGLLARALVDLARERFTLKVDLAEFPPERLGEAVESGNVQFGAGYLPDEAPRGLEFESFEVERFVVVASPAHRLLLRGEIGIADLAGERWLLRNSPVSVLAAWRAAFGVLGHRPPATTVAVGSLQTLAQILRELPALALVDQTSADVLIRGNQAVLLSTALRELQAPIGALRSARRRLSPGASMLLGALRRRYGARDEVIEVPPAGGPQVAGRPA
jgi:DNA-binding transcriptional LysR family regulator